MSRKRTMKWYREQISTGLERSRSKALHEFLFAMMAAYYTDPKKMEKSLRVFTEMEDES